MTVDKFTVIRSKWGEGRLLTDDGKMCCLGFLSKTCGYSDEDLTDKCYPGSNWDKVPAVFRDTVVDDYLDWSSGAPRTPPK